MNRRWWAPAGLLMLLSLVAGCAAPGASYQGPDTGETYYSDVPPSFYDNDPMLRQWFTAPYWMPDVDH
jgi:hypothetical protein